MRKNFYNRIFWITLLSFLMGYGVSALGVAVPASGQGIVIRLNPEYPTALQTVTATAEMYVTDINRAEILWFVDGVLQQRGIGKKELIFQTKDFGDKTKLSVQTNAGEFGQIQAELEIWPTDLNLIWETNTFTPPFYTGKALNSSQSIIKVVAFPIFVGENGQRIDASQLVYSWKKDWKISGKDSGYGKNTFSFAGPALFRQNNITVEVESLDGTFQAKKTIVLKANLPEIIFYENNPLLGILNNTALISQYNLNNEELNVIAYPFFFSAEDLSGLRFDWELNGKKLAHPTNEIIFRQPDSGGGLSNISLEIQNLKKIMQFAGNDFIINSASARDAINYADF